MPKHYCDYCDVYLTHDSTSGKTVLAAPLQAFTNFHWVIVRKAHNSGRNHLQNVRDYYASLGHDKAQNIIDEITRAYETGQVPPGGFGAGLSYGPGMGGLGGFGPPGPGGGGFGGPPPGFGGPRPPFPPGGFNGPPPGMGGPPPPGGMRPPFPGGPPPPGLPPPLMMGGMGGE